MSETNPILENVDDALDVVEKFIAEKLPAAFRPTGNFLMQSLRAFLQVPDNYGGDAD